MKEVANGVWCIERVFVNSHILETGANTCVLVDCGFPGWSTRIRDGVREIHDGESLPQTIVLSYVRHWVLQSCSDRFTVPG